MKILPCRYLDGNIAKDTLIGVLCNIKDCPYENKGNEAIGVEGFYEPIPGQHHCKTEGLIHITETTSATRESDKTLGAIIDKIV